MQSTRPGSARLRTAGVRTRCLAASLVLAALAACADAPSGPQVTVHGGGGDVAVTVELALTQEEQMRGLMWRSELPEGTGMLFVFGEEKERSFWMRNTPIPLDIVFIRGDATIVSIAANTHPYSERAIPSRGPCRYVLEVPGGWAKRHGVRADDEVTLPPGVSAPKPRQ